jgi:hypothetical protein
LETPIQVLGGVAAASLGIFVGVLMASRRRRVLMLVVPFSLAAACIAAEFTLIKVAASGPFCVLSVQVAMTAALFAL